MELFWPLASPLLVCFYIFFKGSMVTPTMEKNSEVQDFDLLRRQMVRDQIVARGIHNPLVIKAMEEVPRHLFVPENIRDRAYNDGPLPIGYDQTISQPYIVAYMTQALRLRGGERVLEIGTGSGYQAAILAKIVSEVYSIERIEELADRAREILSSLGYENICIKVGDGTLGWSEHGPFDAIVVTAGGPRVPDRLLEQLKVGGTLVMPVGEYKFHQSLMRITKGVGNKINKELLMDVLFVPLIGEEGWSR